MISLIIFIFLMLTFSALFILKMDGYIKCSWVIVFLPGILIFTPLIVIGFMYVRNGLGY